MAKKHFIIAAILAALLFVWCLPDSYLLGESVIDMDSVENEAFSTFREYEAHHTLTLSRYDKMLDARRLRDVFLVSATIGIRILAASEAAVFMPRVGGEVGGSLSGTDDGDVTLSWRREF